MPNSETILKYIIVIICALTSLLAINTSITNLVFINEPYFETFITGSRRNIFQGFADFYSFSIDTIFFAILAVLVALNRSYSNKKLHTLLFLNLFIFSFLVKFLNFGIASAIAGYNYDPVLRTLVALESFAYLAVTIYFLGDWKPWSKVNS